MCAFVLEWGSDDLTVYYTRPDSMKRPYALLRHKTCQSIFQDVCLHEEKDERYERVNTNSRAVIQQYPVALGDLFLPFGKLICWVPWMSLGFRDFWAPNFFNLEHSFGLYASSMLYVVCYCGYKVLLENSFANGLMR